MWQNSCITIDMILKTFRGDKPQQYNSKNCIKKFLYYFPKGFTDPKYLNWERNYKWDAHLSWEEQLSKPLFAKLLLQKRYSEICQAAIKIESKTNLLFSFEKMALRDAVKGDGAKSMAIGLFDYLYSKDDPSKRFMGFVNILATLPRRQTRVLTWPLQTVFGFIASPGDHIFLKPKVTKVAAVKYGYDLMYESGPKWRVYENALKFAYKIREDTRSLKPRDMIDLQSFIWVLGSEEYPD